MSETGSIIFVINTTIKRQHYFLLQLLCQKIPSNFYFFFVEMERWFDISVGFSGQLFCYSLSSIRTYRFSLLSSAAAATVHRSIQFLLCPHTRHYPPLFISCHELEWKMFGVSSALYESFYKRITLPLHHVWWFPRSGALSSPVWQCKAFLTAPVAYVTRIRNFHCCLVPQLWEVPASKKTNTALDQDFPEVWKRSSTIVILRYIFIN